MSMMVGLLRTSVKRRIAAIALAIFAVCSVTLVTSASAASPDETTTTPTSVPTPTVTLTQGSGCVSVVATVHNPTPDTTVYLSIYYGDTGNPFDTGGTTYGPGLTDGQVLGPVSVDAASLPSEAYDFGYPVQGYAGYFWNNYVGQAQTYLDLDTSCRNPAPTVIPLPADPTVTDPPGPNNARWDKPENDDQYTWEETPEGHLIVHPTQPGHVFPGNEPSHDYGTAPDSYVPPTIIPVPPAPSVTDPEGPNNARWDKPENDDQYTWTIENIDGQDHLIVRPTQRNTLLEGDEEKHDYGPAKDSYVCPPGSHAIYPEGDHMMACKPDPTTQPTVPVTTGQPTVPTTNSPSSSAAPSPAPTPATTQVSAPTNTVTPPVTVIIDDPARPGIVDPPGPANAYWESQSDTDEIYWVQSDDKRCIVAHTRDGLSFAGGSQFDFGCAPDSEGEQAAAQSSSRADNPTPQPTGNGGDGVRASASGGKIVQLIGIGLAFALVLIGGFVAMSRRKGAHENA